jgi:sarcosine oxidase subunit gamma
MSDLPARATGLEPFFATAANANNRGSNLRVCLVPAMGHINLRGNSNDAGFISSVESVLGLDLPVRSNTMTIDNHRVYWLGPDEWLIVTAHENVNGLVEQLVGALNDQHAAVTDISGSNILLRLAGENVRDVLAKGCTLDFNPDAMPIGHCAQSGLAKAGVLIGHIDDNSTYEIVVRRSFSEYLLLWLQSAGDEFGVEFSIS